MPRLRKIASEKGTCGNVVPEARDFRLGVAETSETNQSTLATSQDVLSGVPKVKPTGSLEPEFVPSS